MTTMPAGWYPDPDQPGMLRYWNGEAWTLSRVEQPGSTPVPTVAPQMAAQPMAPPPGPDKPWYQRGWVIGVGVVLLIGIVGSAMAEDEEAPDETRPAASAPPDDSSEPESAPVDEESDKPQRKRNAGDAGNGQVGSDLPAIGDTFVLPNEVGKTLQAAQDDVQAVSGNPFYFTFSEDATGANRFQILDSGWVVCSQDPAAGSRADDDTIITFYVVKDSETCA